MSCGINSVPIPPRVWSRVQNRCTTNQNNVDVTNDIVYVPLTNQYLTPEQAQYEEQMIQKANILQYKCNSSNLTKKQKYSQISKGFGNLRKKGYATQSVSYTNPNTTSFLRANYTNIPYPNNLVGEPNNISGPYQANVPNPFNCSSNVLQEGGSLVCNTIVDPCSGNVIKTFKNQYCYPTTCSDVPGTPIDLCWYPNIQTWYPRNRYTMSNGLDKFPVNYKGFVSAVPIPEIIPIVNDYLNQIDEIIENSNCSTLYYTQLINNYPISEIHSLLTQYTAMINNPDDRTNVSEQTYNNLTIALDNLSTNMDNSCGFFNIIDIYKNILNSVYTGFSIKNSYQNLNNSTLFYQQDSQILRNTTLLQQYIDDLNSKPVVKVSVEAPQVPMFSAKNIAYHKAYGVPENGEYDPELMSKIEKSMAPPPEVTSPNEITSNNDVTTDDK